MTLIDEDAAPSSAAAGGSEAARVARTAAAIRAVFKAADAEPATPPLLQPAAPYFDVSGEDIRGRLLLVDDPGDVTYCLRPDLTIPVCRLYLERHGGRAAPAAYRYEGPVFRADASGATPPAEAMQFGLERFADPDAEAAEITACSVALEAVRAGGGRVRRLVLGDSRLFEAFVDGLGVTEPETARLKRAFARPDRSVARPFDPAAARPPEHASGLAAALAGLPDAEAEAALKEVYRLAGIEAVGSRPLTAIIERLRLKAERCHDADADRATAAARAFAAIAGPPQDALDTARAQAQAAGVDLDGPLEAWARRLAALADQDALERAVFSIGFARQFDYYDGLVFEIHDPDIGARVVLAGGGRYDALLQRLGAREPVPAVGCMARPDRIAASARVAEADR